MQNIVRRSSKLRILINNHETFDSELDPVFFRVFTFLNARVNDSTRKLSSINFLKGKVHLIIMGYHLFGLATPRDQKSTVTRVSQYNSPPVTVKNVLMVKKKNIYIYISSKKCEKNPLRRLSLRSYALRCYADY